MPLRSRLLPATLCATALTTVAAAGVALTGTTSGVADAPARASAGEVVARFADARAATGTPVARGIGPRTGRSVAAAARAASPRPGGLSATTSYPAHSSGWLPPDPGRAGKRGGWQALQWNFLSGTGVDAPHAWQHLLAAGRPGGRGVTVAVLDTGVAYADRERFRRSPDFSKVRFVRGYDFVNDDPYPNDDNGHGTHVAGTIAEGTDNDVGLTGLAYGVKVMPVKVLDRNGNGDFSQIASGIRWAADNGAKIINLSVEFASTITREDIPDIVDALRDARREGVLVVGAAGNVAAAAVAYPARSGNVLSVGATTQHGCQADYSNEGQDLDMVAPGGGADAGLQGDPSCHPDQPWGLDIFQMTFTRSVRSFGFPTGYFGTSMAAAHVSATAALVIASGLLGPDPTPAAIERRLELTARDLGAPGRDPHYGAGRIDAARATDPAIPVA